LHFLLIGAAFFLLYNLTVKNNYSDTDLKTVIVDKNSLVTFMQYRSKIFNQDEFEYKLSSMSKEEINNLIKDYIREEVLYREALGLGMDKDDYVIKRRMVQKIEFINEDLADRSLEITEDDVKEYFYDNLDEYKIEPNATFTHVFFSKDKNGIDEAKLLAEDEIKLLNNNRVPFYDSAKYGDRFLYHLNYVERTPEFVESHFGREMEEEIFKLNPSDTKWYGPYESPYGFHLVLLTEKNDETIPEIEEVYESILNDLSYELSNKAREKSIKEIIDSYDVKILYEQESPNTSR